MNTAELVVNNTEIETRLDVVPTDFNTLLSLLQKRIDLEAEDYNQLVDTLAETEGELTTTQLKTTQQALELQELRAKVESLTAGNKLLMDKTRDLEAKLKTSSSQLENSIRAENLYKNRHGELEAQLKTIKAVGDPAKLLGQNKTLRDKNAEILAKNNQLQQQLSKALAELKDLAKNGGDFHYLPSYSSAEGENVYVHPKVIKVVEAGELHTKVALTYWRKEGVGRVITWDGEQLHLASFNHKQVDAKMAPTQEVVDFCQSWFLKNVVVHGRVQNIASSYRLKGTK